MTAGDARQAALAEIRRLAEVHDLGVAEVVAALKGGAPRGVAARVLGYLGGLFLFAGLAAFIAVNWDSLPSLARVLVTLGLGLALFVAALAVDRAGSWPTMVGPGLLAAEVLQPMGLLVAFDEYGSGGDWRFAFLVTGAVLMAQALVTLRITVHGVLVFAAMGFGAQALANLFDLAGVPAGLTAIALGGSLTLIALSLPRARFASLVGFWTALGAVIGYLGAFDLLQGTAVEPAFAVLAGAGIYLSVRVRGRTLLAVSVLTLLLYLSYFTVKHFAESLGWPLVLILIGSVLVGLGAFAYRTHARYFAARPEPSSE